MKRPLIVLGIIFFALWAIVGTIFVLRSGNTLPPAAVIPATTTAPVVETTANPAQEFDLLAANLSGPDAVTRASANQQLMALSADGFMEFRKWLAATTMEPARKAAVGEAVDQRTLNPPPVALERQSIPLNQVLYQVNQKLGTHVATFRLMPPPVYILNAATKPFWQLISDLNEQSTVEVLAANTSGFGLASSTWGVRHYGVSGPFACYARVASLRLPDPKERRLQLVCVIACDPRLYAISVHPTLTLGLDDTGHSLADEKWPDITMNMSGNATDFGPNIKLPEGAATSITGVKVKATFLVSLEEASETVDDLEALDGKTLHVGGTDVAFGFKRTHTGYKFSYVPTKEDRSATVRVEIFDPNGDRLFSMSGSSAINSVLLPNSQLPAPVPPLFLKVSVPIRTREVTTEFDLRDLPLPPFNGQ